MACTRLAGKPAEPRREPEGGTGGGTEAGLRGAGAEGYPIKLFARSGDTAIIDIPRPVITSLLAMIDADPAITAAPAKVSQAP